jgi:hypothetical protein
MFGRAETGQVSSKPEGRRGEKGGREFVGSLSMRQSVRALKM